MRELRGFYTVDQSLMPTEEGDQRVTKKFTDVVYGRPLPLHMTCGECEAIWPRYDLGGRRRGRAALLPPPGRRKRRPSHPAPAAAAFEGLGALREIGWIFLAFQISLPSVSELSSQISPEYPRKLCYKLYKLCILGLAFKILS